MVEFKDDGTATTLGKTRENRDAESAVVADLVAVELDDAGLNLNAKRLPILARIYGAVVLLDGLATLPIMVISILYAVREILDGHVHVDAMSLTFILSAVRAVVLVVSAVCLIVFGVMLLRNHRRYAARWTYVLMPLTLADGMLSLALIGLGPNLLMPLVQMIILIVISVTDDPSLRNGACSARSSAWTIEMTTSRRWRPACWDATSPAKATSHWTSSTSSGCSPSPRCSA